jgi:hypothetical protein
MVAKAVGLNHPLDYVARVKTIAELGISPGVV